MTGLRLTDEEIYWMAGPRQWSPWLSTLSESELGVATTAALRSLVARGFARLNSDEPELSVEALGEFRRLGEARAAATGVWFATYWTHRDLAVALYDTETGLVSEKIDDGVHELRHEQHSDPAALLLEVLDQDQAASRPDDRTDEPLTLADLRSRGYGCLEVVVIDSRSAQEATDERRVALAGQGDTWWTATEMTEGAAVRRSTRSACLQALTDLAR